MVRFNKVLVVGMMFLFAVSFGAFAQTKVKAAFVVSNQANESQAFSAKEFLKYGADYGFEVSTFDAKGDTQAESQIVTNCIAQKFKAIFLNPNDIHAIVPAIIKAKQAGLIVGMFSSELVGADQKYRDFAATSDDNLGGQLAAQQFIKAFPNGATIVEIGGQAGHNAQLQRHDGFNGDKGIKGSKIQVLDFKACQQWATDQAQAIMEDDIVKYGNKIQGVFVHWDNGCDRRDPGRQGCRAQEPVHRRRRRQQSRLRSGQERRPGRLDRPGLHRHGQDRAELGEGCSGRKEGPGLQRDSPAHLRQEHRQQLPAAPVVVDC